MLFRILCCLFVVAGSASAEPDAIDSALAAMGITRAEFRVDPEVMLTRSGTTHKLPVFDQWSQHPLRIPTWEHNWRSAMLSSEGKLHPLFQTCAALIGQGTRRDLIAPTPLEKYRTRAAKNDALITAIRELDRDARVHGIKDVPVPVQRAAALLLFATRDALDWRRMALRNIPEKSWSGLYAYLSEPLERAVHDTVKPAEPLFPGDYDRFYAQEDVLDKIDLSLLISAGDDLSAAIDTVASELTAMPAAQSFRFRCDTKYGLISLSSGTNDEYDADEPVLLSIDLSGDDTYHTGGGTYDVRHPASIVIDVQGNDHYQSPETRPAFGGAILGFGIVSDMSGNDRYESSGFYTQGCGIAGVGLLRDNAGDDTYRAIGGAQGYGSYGVGLLSDLSGHDTYDAYCESQGCGMTLGFGLLCDILGNDRYTANDSDIIFPSAQSDKHNTSMSQGAGYGPRRDYIDAHSLAGGIGMLVDSAGNDIYSGGVFSQAVGYWYGIGILDDRSGNDEYHAVWYGQSATAHMGLSYLNDGSGNDQYTATMSVSAGAAHDLSTSLFIDESGNDRYQQASNALGRSLNSSVALFADLGGNDSYAGKESLGRSVNFSSSGWRAETWTTAVFLDLGGDDSYPEDGMKNNTSWKQEMSGPLPLLRGIGVDGDRFKLKWD